MFDTYLHTHAYIHTYIHLLGDGVYPSAKLLPEVRSLNAVPQNSSLLSHQHFNHNTHGCRAHDSYRERYDYALVDSA